MKRKKIVSKSLETYALKSSLRNYSFYVRFGISLKKKREKERKRNPITKEKPI